MTRTRTSVVSRASTLPLPASAVWARVTTPAGIRHELRPWLSMTTPPGLRGLGIEDAAGHLGRPLGKAWLLALGVVPVEYDDMTLIALEPGRAFHERSRMLALSHWEHRRTVEPLDPATCRVTDELTFVPRFDVPGARRLAVALVGALFAHRHRRLAAWATSARR